MTTIHGLTGTASLHTGIVTVITTAATNRAETIATGSRIMTTGKRLFIKGMKAVNVWTTGPGSGNHKRIVTEGRWARFMAAIAGASEDNTVTVATEPMADRSGV